MDYKTLFAVLVSVMLIQAISLQITWRQNREEIGIRDWAYAGAFMSLASFLNAVGLDIDVSHEMLSHGMRIVGSALGAGGWYLVWIGTRRFFQRPASNYFSIVVFIGLFSVALAMKIDVSWRVMLVSFAIALFSGLTLREFLQPGFMRRPTVLLMSVMLLFTCLAWLARGVAHMHSGRSLGLVDSIALYNAIVASLTLTVSMIVLTNERINQRLQEQATRDPLTGAMNRRAFFETSIPVMATLHREAAELAVCVMDIDHFKKVNDQYGHAVGDRVLKHVSSIAHEVLREGDLFARYGGEEFVALLGKSDRTQAEHAMQRLRDVIGSRPLDLGGEQLYITFSVGIAHARGPSRLDLDTLLEAADRSMYLAKEAGRDRIIIHPETFGAVWGDNQDLVPNQR